MLFSSFARAQRQPVARGAGIGGGALLGAELVTLSEAVLGARAPSLYVLGGVAGAGAGAAVGWVAEERADPDVSVLLLAGGVALLVPTIVWVGNALEPEPPAQTAPGARLLLPACDLRFSRNDSSGDRGLELRLRVVGAAW